MFFSSADGRKDSSAWWWQIVAGAEGFSSCVIFFWDSFLVVDDLGWPTLKILEIRLIFSRLLYD